MNLGDLKRAIAVSDALERLPDETPVKLEMPGRYYQDIVHMRSDEIDTGWVFVLSTIEHDEDLDIE